MKKILKGIFIFIFVVVIEFLLFKGCMAYTPSKNSVEKRFLKHCDDIQTVVAFMVDSEYDSIHIYREDISDWTMWADFDENVAIEDKHVRDAIEQLLGPQGDYHSIFKSGNTIDLIHWSGVSHSCGIAYSINGTDLPYIDYPTVLEPLSEPGWYYYVNDYNTWRSEHS